MSHARVLSAEWSRENRACARRQLVQERRTHVLHIGDDGRLRA
jgi:hypothetical protein